MRDRELYATILGVTAPWTVDRVDLDVAGGAVHVWLARTEGARAQCPECQSRVRSTTTATASGAISTPASYRPGSMRACRASTARPMASCRVSSRGRPRARSSPCCSSGWRSTGCGKPP